MKKNCRYLSTCNTAVLLAAAIVLSFFLEIFVFHFSFFTQKSGEFPRTEIDLSAYDGYNGEALPLLPENATISIDNLNIPVRNVYRPRGCQFCNNTGYKGRIAVHEIMYLNEELKSAIVNGKNIDVLREIARKNGMIPLWETCRGYVFNGITSIQELMTLDVT